MPKVKKLSSLTITECRGLCFGHGAFAELVESLDEDLVVAERSEASEPEPEVVLIVALDLGPVVHQRQLVRRGVVDGPRVPRFVPGKCKV